MGQLADIVTQSRSLGAETRATYLRCVARFEKAHPDPRNWNAFTVEKWRDRLLTKVSAQTANKHLHALRYASRRLEALGMGHDFARAAESAKTTRKKRREALTPDELVLIVRQTAGDEPQDVRDRAIIVLFARSGIRVSGLCGLTWQDIRQNRVRIRLKGGDEHVFYLDDEVVAVLASWQTVLEKRSGPVFPAIGREKAMSRQAVHQMIARRAKAAGIKRPVYPHLLRHTFVSWGLAEGIPPQRLMPMTGHRSLGAFSGYVTDLEAERDPVGGHLPSLLGRKKR